MFSFANCGKVDVWFRPRRAIERDRRAKIGLAENNVFTLAGML